MYKSMRKDPGLWKGPFPLGQLPRRRIIGVFWEVSESIPLTCTCGVVVLLYLCTYLGCKGCTWPFTCSWMTSVADTRANIQSQRTTLYWVAFRRGGRLLLGRISGWHHFFLLYVHFQLCVMKIIVTMDATPCKFSQGNIAWPHIIRQ